MGISVLESSIVEYTDVTIPANSLISNDAFLGGSTICGIYIPSVMTASTISFLASHSQTNYVQVKTDTTVNFSKSIVANSYLPIAPADLVGINFFKISINTAQSAASTFKVVSRKIQ